MPLIQDFRKIDKSKLMTKQRTIQFIACFLLVVYNLIGSLALRNGSRDYF
ncbi:hypothetical protein SAMN05216565_101350 [Litchfieldia salsa]|uniref:Uncharacterized protein n=1 Tax=Litchfieldia salsa TaxID=930152 RepID=A0A1H0PL02_9BACI|nr:hypothetical protein SAMN05216565_101350 [Litchfieldia salsa]